MNRLTSNATAVCLLMCAAILAPRKIARAELHIVGQNHASYQKWSDSSGLYTLDVEAFAICIEPINLNTPDGNRIKFLPLGDMDENNILAGSASHHDLSQERFDFKSQSFISSGPLIIASRPRFPDLLNSAWARAIGVQPDTGFDYKLESHFSLSFTVGISIEEIVDVLRGRTNSFYSESSASSIFFDWSCREVVGGCFPVAFKLAFFGDWVGYVTRPYVDQSLVEIEIPFLPRVETLSAPKKIVRKLRAHKPRWAADEEND